MFGAPFGDFAVVAREEDAGNFHAAEVGGFGVLRVFEIVAIREGFDSGGGFAPEDSRDEADDGVDQDEGRQFPAG